MIELDEIWLSQELKYIAMIVKTHWLTLRTFQLTTEFNLGLVMLKSLQKFIKLLIEHLNWTHVA